MSDRTPAAAGLGRSPDPTAERTMARYQYAARDIAALDGVDSVRISTDANGRVGQLYACIEPDLTGTLRLWDARIKHGLSIFEVSVLDDHLLVSLRIGGDPRC